MVREELGAMTRFKDEAQDGVCDAHKGNLSLQTCLQFWVCLEPVLEVGQVIKRLSIFPCYLDTRRSKD